MGNVALVGSNALFILPAWKASKKHRYTRSPLYILMMIASIVHHLCLIGYCAFSADVCRKGDFFFAQLLIPVTMLYIIKFHEDYAPLERWLIFLFGAALFVVEVKFNEPFVIQLVIALASLLMIFAYWIYYAIELGKCRLPSYDWHAFSYGIGFSTLACALFATQSRWHAGYPWVHAAWHSCAAIGQYWILSIRDAAPKDAVMDTRINVRASRLIK